ncbi:MULTISPECIES: GGDEF domain-containing protein [Acinetobacter]|uniref:GGDEF domain-containing protein n=1 Tax=Acinetobacter TaxID=469 RepID=UPI000738788B|nr:MULTISPECIES: GGDEF domain-containing protein [Acinetobacter]AXF44282.1 GGDEF domain-containing protein [Acinetobacter johnsonii]KUG37417.1 diguanylate cyclase [Acinetobacter johnsonii]MDH1276471.1 GGDEF domain-containing protein [Acinetobacter johnsonii]MDQ8974094.1 GGDEF domain-containing protein [Acinetobacter johnsonii]UNT43092.1 GGDEF domain-containing protein [Acinetobacter sp. LUNF3]
MREIRSEYLSQKLYIAMSIIILSLCSLSIPLMVKSYRDYIKTNQALTEIQALQAVADLANKISRERAPANKLMSSNQQDFAKHVLELKLYRLTVDEQMQKTLEVLKHSNLPNLDLSLFDRLDEALMQGRQQVDAYAALPREQRNAETMDQAILKMFSAWDRSHDVLKDVIAVSEGKDTAVSNFYVQILLLADLRDQAGRAASNVMAHVAFKQPIPETNLARSLQTRKQVMYLWELIDTLQPERDKTEEFKVLHQAVYNEFLAKGLLIVERLMNESIYHRPYYLTGTQLTEAIVDKFSTVVELQNYLLKYSVEKAIIEKHKAQNILLTTVGISLISIFAALFTMIYARKRVFSPLIQAREILFDLSHSSIRPNPMDTKDQPANMYSLFTAIQQLKQTLQQRDALEFRLKNIAHLDSLTGVANRYALNEYIKLLENQPTQFSETCLMVIDIDHFKQVNDVYGHLMGDQVIQFVAEKLKENIRTSDLLVRYGGDEFIVLIENVGMERALKIAEKIRSEIYEAKSVDSIRCPDLKVSISIGVVIGATSWMALLEKADRALFQAKEQGKNKVAS